MAKFTAGVPGKKSIAKVLGSRRMAVCLIMGFASGLPLLMTITLLQAWMKEAGVDLGTIGLMSLVGLPYTLKFLWAPFVDRYIPPFLGRRRGWLLIFQLSLAGSVCLLAAADPAGSPWAVAAAALAVTFFSASQDIVIDAYRREDLPDEELGLGSSLYIAGYRIGMWVCSAGGLILADHVSFPTVYLIMAACLVPAMLATVMTPEPSVAAGRPLTLRQAVIEPFDDYFSRKGAILILAFILLYKLGDSMASAMTIPFYLDIDFTKTEIGTIVKTIGIWATIGGGLAGGSMMIKLGINRSLWIFGILQMVSTAGFALLARLGHSLAGLTAVVGFENLTSGMGTAAYAAFMASLTNKKFTATQYALLSSLMGVPRVLASAATGYLAAYLGWVGFFIFCTLIALPGLALLARFAPLKTKNQPPFHRT